MSPTLDEMLEMVAALLRLLRTPVLPQVSPEPRENLQAASKSGGLFGWLLGGNDDASTSETEQECINPLEPAQFVSSDEENDGPLLLASWNVLCQFCPSMHVALGRKNSQLVLELTSLSKFEKTRKILAPAVRVPSAISTPRAPLQDESLLLGAEIGAASASIVESQKTPVGVESDQGKSSEHPSAVFSAAVEIEYPPPQLLPQSQSIVALAKVVQLDTTLPEHPPRSSTTPSQHRRMPIGSIGVSQAPTVPLDVVPKQVARDIPSTDGARLSESFSESITPTSKLGDAQPEQVPEMPDLLNGRGTPSLVGANLGLCSPVPLARFLVAPAATTTAFLEIDPTKPLLV
jgi:hypothetical protein